MHATIVCGGHPRPRKDSVQRGDGAGGITPAGENHGSDTSIRRPSARTSVRPLDRMVLLGSIGIQTSNSTASPTLNDPALKPRCVRALGPAISISVLRAVPSGFVTRRVIRV